MFPIELFDSANISRMQHVQLSCVSFRPSSPFRGFPKLKKLHLHLFDVSRMYFEGMLSDCANLEWLSFVRCHLDDDLNLKQPMSCLRYLRVAHCSITRVQLHAENLQSFVYHGKRLLIDLGQVKQLETAELCLYGCTIEYVLDVLPTLLLGVQNVTLQATLLVEDISSFSWIKFPRLLLLVCYSDSSNILSLASFLRASPLIEELEMHFDASCLEGVGWGTRRSLPRWPYNYPKKCILQDLMGSRDNLNSLCISLKMPLP